jgi:hypothetical protein
MTETNGQGARRRTGGKVTATMPERVTSTTHVNVALPFAKVELMSRANICSPLQPSSMTWRAY